MPRVHALLVGIDRYARPGLDLRGCVNDVRLADRLLRDRVAPGDLVVETLVDSQATRAAVIEAFRRHLGGLGVGDVALFWFCGHGSTGPLPAAISYAESSGMCQTLVCHDSRAGAPDLYDKELGVLAQEVVTTGAQLVTIVDSCHSRSAMRDVPAPGLTARLAPAPATPPDPRDLLPLTAAPGRQLPGHVALAACDEWERANERSFPDGWHGVFTEALGRALARLGPDATYRQVYSYARCRVEGRLSRQIPTLEALGDLADVEFLGGTLRPRATQVTMRFVRERWEVDVGSVHGVVDGARFGVHRAVPLREVRVAAVHSGYAVVEPVGWAPDLSAQYEMVLTDVPLPPVTVSIDTDPGVAARLAGAIAPSPHIRIDASASGLGLRVVAADDHGGSMRVTSVDGRPLTEPAGVEQTVRDLEHIARWLQVRNLESASPALEEAVRVDLVPSPPGEIFEYAWNGTAWIPPTVSIRLRNTTGRKLFCVLLDLTDRHRMHANLFPGAYVEAHWTAAAGNGAPIALTLPPDRPVEPGASVTDWLVLLVAEEPFSSAPFSLPRLREVPRSAPRGTRTGITGVLDRLGLLATRRDLSPAPPPPALDWAVRVVELTTRVPASARS